MLHLMRVIDKATGCIFVPPRDAKAPPDADNPGNLPPSLRPNAYALLSTAAGQIHGPRSDVRDVQERWIDAREEWDAWERTQWEKEGRLAQEAAAKQTKIRERGSS